MAKLKRSRTRRLILDLGSSTLRVCELTPGKSGYQLSKYYQRELAIDPELPADQQNAMRAQALRELLEASQIRHKRAVVGVPGQSVFMRPRALPPVPEYKVTQIVRYEIQQQIPFSVDQIALDYQVLGRTEAQGYEVLMAAIKIDVVERRLELLRAIKRTPETVDVCPLAAYNWLKFAGELGQEGECVALIDIGGATTDIALENQGQFRNYRGVNFGGNDVTKAIANGFGVDFAEAESLKRERAFAPTGDPERDGKQGEVVGQALRRLVSEITRSFGYFRSQPGGGAVQRVVLTGGGARLRNLVPYLQRALGVEVRLAQPLRAVAVDQAAAAQANNEQSAVALGLALRAHQDVPLALNLAPPRVLEAQRRREKAVYWAIIVVALGLLGASVIPERDAQNDRIQEQTQAYLDRIRDYDPALSAMAGGRIPESEYEEELAEAKSRVEQYQRQVNQMDRARNKLTNWLEHLQELHAARPGEGEGWILFSAVQTTHIGELEDGGGRGGAMGMPGMGGGDMGGMMGMMGGMMPGMGGSTGNVLPSSGFPGLSPGGAGGGMGGMMGMMGGGMMPGMGGGGMMGMPGMGGGQQEQDVKAPPAPNGLTVWGYGDSLQTIRDFRRNLERSPLFLEKGVYLLGGAKQTSPRELGNPRGPGGNMGGFGGGEEGGGMGGMGPMGGMGAMGGMAGMGGAGGDGDGMMGGGQGSQFVPTLVPGVPKVFFFRIEVQFAGEPIDVEARRRDQQQGRGGFPGMSGPGGGGFPGMMGPAGGRGGR